MPWSCYKTVDFATAASQNDVCMIQGKCHKMIWFQNFSKIEDLIKKIVIFFVIICVIFVFL